MRWLITSLLFLSPWLGFTQDEFASHDAGWSFSSDLELGHWQTENPDFSYGLNGRAYYVTKFGFAFDAEVGIHLNRVDQQNSTTSGIRENDYSNLYTYDVNYTGHLVLFQAGFNPIGFEFFPKKQKSRLYVGVGPLWIFNPGHFASENRVVRTHTVSYHSPMNVSSETSVDTSSNANEFLFPGYEDKLTMSIKLRYERQVADNLSLAIQSRVIPKLPAILNYEEHAYQFGAFLSLGITYRL